MKSGKLSDKPSPDQIIADPRRRKGHRIRDGVVAFDDSEAHEESREANDPAAAP